MEGATADAAVARAGDMVTAGDDLSTRTTTVSGALSTYADALHRHAGRLSGFATTPPRAA